MTDHVDDGTDELILAALPRLARDANARPPAAEYFADPSRVERCEENPETAIRVLASREDRTPIGMAYRLESMDDERTTYILFVDGAELPGQWLIQGNVFTPAPS